jgi:hypothetical protein
MQTSGSSQSNRLMSVINRFGRVEVKVRVRDLNQSRHEATT